MRFLAFLSLAAPLAVVNAAPQTSYKPVHSSRTIHFESATSPSWIQAGSQWLQTFLHGRPSEAPASETHTRSDRNTDKYINDVVLRFNITSSDDARAISGAITALYLDVWSNTPEHVDVRMSKDTVPVLMDFLPKRMGNSYSRPMHSLLESVMSSYPREPEALAPLLRAYDEASAALMKPDSLFFQDYRPLSVIVPWMTLLESMYPGYVQVVEIGKSFEGRTIHALKVGTNLKGEGKKKTIIVTGAAHAREWISVSTVNYMAYAMVTGYRKGDIGIDAMVDNFDWLFVPTLNVDGYVYSWEVDRLWRKNRQPTSVPWCKGIDLDRAYDFHFDDSPQSSSNPCSDIFPGGHPFEATEARIFSDWVTTYTSSGENSVVALLDLHSYSQQILYPYSYSCESPPPDLENLEELGIGLAKAIRIQSGEHYEVTSACEGTGFASYPGTSGSGSMLDYFYEKHKVPYAYQIKLRDTGNHGFLLPKGSIVPTGAELFSLIRYLAQFLMDDGSPKSVPQDMKEAEL